MKKSLLLGLSLLFVFSLALAGCGADEAGQTDDHQSDVEVEEKGTLTFGVTPWTSTIPPTYVAKAILEELGYEVDLQEGDVGVVFTALARGDIDIFMDAWLPDMHRNYMEEFGDKLEDIAVSYPDGELGWVVNASSGIEAFEELKGNEDLFDHKIYGIEEGAGMTITSREMIEAYELDLEYVPSSETGMLTQAKRLIDQGEPVLFLGWRPHPMFVDWDLKVLEDPDQYFETSEVHVITSEGLEDRASEAYEFLSNWSIPVGEVEKMIIEIENDKSPEDVAKAWIEENRDHVDAILEGLQ